MPIEPEVLVVIPARWESSRFPGKPLAEILGKPMIQRVVEQARLASSVSKIVVATDDERIAQVVRDFGGEVQMTSRDHPSGTDRVAEVADKYNYPVVVNVQGDEPMIPPENIDKVVQPFLQEGGATVTTLMTPIINERDMFDSNITKVVTDSQGRALYFSKGPIPYDRVAWPDARRVQEFTSQAGNWGHKHIGIYGYSREFILRFSELKSSQLEKIEKLEQLRLLENGISIQVVETDKDSIGVDCMEDLTAVNKILADRAN